MPLHLATPHLTHYELIKRSLESGKHVLVETDGNIEKAIEILREKGLAKAAKKASRIASEGLVEAYIHILLELKLY